MTRRAALATAVLVLGLATVGRAQVKLEYKFDEGSTARFRSTTRTHQVLTINATDVETRAEEVSVTSYAVGSRRPDGKLPIVVKLESFRNQVTLPMGLGDVTYDSANPPARKSDNPLIAMFEDVFRVLTDMAYTIVLDRDNKVAAVEGAEKVQEKAGELDPNGAKLLKGQIEPDKLKHDFEQRVGSLPTILVRRGEPWERTEVLELGAGQTFTFKKRYEYAGTVEQDGATLDRIDVKVLSVAYAIDPDADAPLKVNNSDLKVESTEGSILFDRAAGVAVERKGSTRIKGDMTLSAGGMDLPAKLDLTLDSDTRLLKGAK